MKTAIYILVITLMFSCLNSKAQEVPDFSENKDSLEVMTYDLNQIRASMYLNECAYSLTRILKSGNKIVLEDEQYKLNNTYKWENVSQYSSVFDFRKSLQSQLNEMIINETNRERFKKEFERQKNSAARDALISAISGVQVNVNMVSIVSNLLISSARAYMDYGKRKDDLNTELDEQIWQLEQNHLTSITILRNELFDVINQTFREYQISDRMFLREKHFEEFFNILSNKDAELKLISLNENVRIFQSFPPYWFETGCCHIDNYEINGNKAHLDKAWECFSIYEKLNNECPLFLTDERLGMIALYKLQYISNLSKEETLKYIEIIKENIGTDSSALLYAALQYDIRLRQPNESMNMMRRNLDNPALTGKNEIVLAAAAIWDKVSSDYIKNIFIKAVVNATNLDLNTYISFLYKVMKEDSINISPLTNRLLSAFKIDCKEYDDDIFSRFAIECCDDYFIADRKNWKISIEDNNIITGSNRIYSTVIELSDPDHFFSQNEMKKLIMKHNKYFNEYPAEIEKAHLISRHTLGDKEYYYLSSGCDWNTIVPDLTYKSSKTDAPKHLNTANIEKEYIKFYNKFAVNEISYDFKITDVTDNRGVRLPDTPRYILKVSVYESESADIELLFTTDYIEEGSTYFNLYGILYNDEVITL